MHHIPLRKTPRLVARAARGSPPLQAGAAKRNARLRLRSDRALLAACPDDPPPASEASDALRVVRDLDRYPVRITIIQPVEATLADWRGRAVASGIGVLVVVAAFGGLTALGLR